MDGLLALSGLAIGSAVLALVLKKEAPQMAMLITLAAGLFILATLFESFRSIAEELRGVALFSDALAENFRPLLKVLGIAVVTKISAQMCLDAGERALSAQVELAGVAAALAVTLPLALSVLRTIGELI